MKNEINNQEFFLNSEQILKKIKDLLQLKTDNELSEVLKLSHRSRINYWKNNNYIEIDKILNLCYNYNISLDYLFFDNIKTNIYDNNIVSNQVSEPKAEYNSTEIEILKSQIELLKNIILELNKNK